MSKPAARHRDDFDCPQVTAGIAHEGGKIETKHALNVYIDKRFAVMKGSEGYCEGTRDVNPIREGSINVFINGMPAARAGDSMEHGGVITQGSTTVFIGG